MTIRHIDRQTNHGERKGPTMKESDQVNLSRYIDSDLSPLERKGVESSLESDPAARRMASEYALIRRYVKDLPREPIEVDIVPTIHAALNRKRWPLSLPAKSPAIAGIMAASVLIACFSVAGYVAMNSDSVDRVLPPVTITNSQVDSRESTPSTPGVADLISKPATAKLSEIETRVEEKAETPNPQIAMAPPRMAGGLDAATAKPPAPAKVAIITRNGNPPEPIKDQFANFLKATKRIDRRHALRLHVVSASDRQIDSILSVIGQYRAADSPVMERDIPKSGEKPTSLAFVALIPTGQVAEFQETLRHLPGIELELDKPEESIFRKAELAEGFRAVGDDVIDRAIAATGKVVPEATAPQPGPHKKTEIAEAVPDAISQPLKIDAESGESRGTLDQVLVLIRTDPLKIESKQSKTSRKLPADK